jgi:hypothetical protein
LLPELVGVVVDSSSLFVYFAQRKGKRTIAKGGALSAAWTVLEVELAATVARESAGEDSKRAMQDAGLLGQSGWTNSASIGFEMTNQENEQSTKMN